MCRRSCLRAGSRCQPLECQPSDAVAGWQTLTWVATGLDLTKSDTRITLLPNPGTIDTALGQSYCFDDMALVDGGTAPPSSDCLTWVADAISRYSLFTVGLRASFYARSWTEASCPIAV
ncbi:MAG: hypothetical protein U5L05_05615 [Rubrivivax sp.]|nr:hypothetical protein [Rubrivivax sp.]